MERSMGKNHNRRTKLMKLIPVIIAVAVFAFLFQGCKPQGGGAISGTVVATGTGGQHPGYYTLIIDENSITVEALSASSAIIYWETNFPATSTVEYGEKVSYTNTTSVDTRMTLKHRRELYNLKYNNTYHFRCISNDEYNNVAISKDHSFVTASQNFPPKAVVLSDTIETTISTAKLDWTISEDSDFKEYKIRYDTTSEVTVSSPVATTITEKLLNSYTVTDLAAQTQYYFRVFVMDTGEVETGSNTVAAATPIDYTPPEPVKFTDPEKITTDTITIKWERYSGDYFSSYKIYKSLSPGFQMGITPEVTITNQDSVTWEDTALAAGTTYYYKMLITNIGGYSALGDEVSFSTYSYGQKLKTYSNIYAPSDVIRVKTEFFISSFSEIQIFSPSEERVITTIEVRGDNGRLSKSSDEESLYFTSETYSELRVVDTSSRYVENRATFGRMISSVTPSRDESFLYVPGYDDNTLYVLDRDDLEIQARLTTGLNPVYVANAVNQDRIIVANSGTSSVNIYKSGDLSDSGEVSVGKSPVYILADPGGTIIYILNKEDGTITRYDIQSNTVIDTTSVGSQPVDMLIINNGRGLLVLNSGDDTVKKFDLPAMTEKYSFYTGDEPMGMEVSSDERTLYVVNYRDDSMTVHAIE
jgi:6-phosphogluconolactonase (cycloisomerase 2 family)